VEIEAGIIAEFYPPILAALELPLPYGFPSSFAIASATPVSGKGMHNFFRIAPFFCIDRASSRA